MASEILVKINVESGQADVSLKKAKVSVNKLAAAEKRLVEVQKKEAISIAAVNLQIKERIRANNQAAAETIKNTNKSSGQFRTQVGLNNAILTEAGRAASDARFGFNGVANNVGQLASLFGSLINTSDNVLTSLKNLGKSLMGTGGILIAIQLLIAYGDQVYNFFTGMSEAAVKAEKAMKKLEGTVQSQRRELLGYIEVLNDSNISEEVRVNALKELNVVSKETVQDYEDGKISLDKLTESVELYIKQQRLRGQLDALLSSNEQVFAEREKVRSVLSDMQVAKEAGNLEKVKKLYEDNVGFFTKFSASTEDLGVSMAEAFVGDFSNADYIGAFQKASKDIVKEYDATVKSIAEIQGQLIANREDPSGGEKGLSDNLTQFLDLSKKIQAARADIRKGAAIDDMDAIRIQGENEEIQLEAQAEVFLDKQKQRLEKKLITQEQYNESELQAQEELAEAIDATQEKTANRQLNLQGKRNENANQLDIESSFIREEIMLNEELMEDEILGRRAGKALSFQQERLNTEIKGLKARLEAEKLHVEQRAELQKQLSEAELKESGIRARIADAEANAKIQSLILFQKALSVSSKIAGENSKAGKALAVSAALVSTYLSAQKAFQSQFEPVPTLDSPVRGAAAAAIAVASGLLNVKAILSTNPAGQSSAGGGGASVTAPNFNVVGASATNQLAGAVAGQVNAPLRAYVVGSDISDQQELDRSIISTAGIG